MSHSMNLSERLRAWITSELDRTGKTRRDLATFMHLAPSGVTRLLAGDREASTEEIIKLAHFFNDPEGFLRLLAQDFPDYELVRKSDLVADRKVEAEDHDVNIRQFLGVSSKTNAAKQVFVLSTQKGDETCDLLIEDRVLGRMPIPEGLQKHPGVVALLFRGEVMTPMIRDGDPIFLVPANDWEEDEPLFLCESAELTTEGHRKAFVGLLVDADPERGTLHLRHLRNSKHRKIQVSEMETIWRVATLSELFPL